MEPMNVMKARLSFNRFKGDQRFSMLAGSNNINKSTFSFNDVVSSMRRVWIAWQWRNRWWSWFWRGTRRSVVASILWWWRRWWRWWMTGINSASNSGINYTNKLWSKVEVQGSYFFSSSENQNGRNSLSQNYYGDSTTSEDKYAIPHNINNNHRLNIRLQYEIDFNNSILLTSNFTEQNSESHSFDTSYN